MPRLLRDRYCEHSADRVWDLATGDVIARPAPEALPSLRSISLAPLGEVLDHGREGVPRWIVTDASGVNLERLVAAIADDACARGFVPIAVDLYSRLRGVLDDDLRERALVLIAGPTVPLPLARAALLHAAARSDRPHVLLTFRVRQPAARPFLVREARAVFGVPAGKGSAVAPLSDDVRRHLARGARAVEFERAGRHAAAERLLRDVAGALARRGALVAAGETCVSLGRLLLERGRATQADDAFGEAADYADTAHHGGLASSARIWQAAARTDAGRLTAAESLCRAVLLAGEPGPGERARAEAVLARVLLWQGRVDDAAALPFVEKADGVVDPFVDATAVRVLVDRGEIFRAGLKAGELLARVDGMDDPRVRMIPLVAHLRVLLAMGDLRLADERLQEIECAAKASRGVLRLARARLLWVDALHRAGRRSDAQRALERVVRLRRVAPALLRGAIDERVRAATNRVAPTRGVTVATPLATALVTIAQREESDGDAVRRLWEFAARALGSSRLELWSADAGPASVILATGTGLPTTLGPRVLDVGMAIGPESGDPAHEIATPIRLGTRLVGVIAARWPPGSGAPPNAAEVLALTAAVAAPRVDGLLASARDEARAATAVPELVGESSAIADLRKAIARAALAPFAVLIEGESGVGKELVARAIHQMGPRRERRFCDVNCAALPDELIEAELFGHARGAFTGAVADRAGLFEEADGGTLFLDEVAELSPRAQAKLLRVLQQQEVRRVGETFSRKVDVRVISAANRDLRVEAAAGRFRQDLLYRLDVIRMQIPPLRERPDDIPLLAAAFWRTAAARVGTTATLTHAVLGTLARYHWPGNVRELQNAMAALAVEAPARGTVRAALLPATITGTTTVTAGRLAAARAQFERRFVEVALARAGGSRSRAARELGLSRQGLLKLMARLGMTR